MSDTSTTTPHIDQVRSALLDTLTALRDKDYPIDLDRVKAMVSVSNTLVDTVRVENDYLKLTGQSRSAFLADKSDGITRIGGNGPTPHNPFPVSVSHRLGE